MIFDNGFTFSNQLCEFDYLDYQDYDLETIRVLKITPIENSLIRVYDYQTNSQPLLDFLGVNHHDEDSILQFLRKYGFFVDPCLANWDIDYDTRKNNYRLITKSLIENIFARFKATVNLISAFKQNNLGEILKYCVFIILDESEIEYNNENNVYDFSNEINHTFYRFYSIFRSPKETPTLEEWEQLTFQQQINYALDRVPKTEPGESWQKFIELFTRIRDYCVIVDLNTTDYIQFDKSPSEIISMFTRDDSEFLKELAASIIETELTAIISNIYPRIEITNGTLKGNLKVPNLLSALYFDMSLRESHSTLLKKCENPTCNCYFETTINNTRKKYCSLHCSQLMAKRKQREREKAKGN